MTRPSIDGLASCWINTRASSATSRCRSLGDGNASPNSPSPFPHDRGQPARRRRVILADHPGHVEPVFGANPSDEPEPDPRDSTPPDPFRFPRGLAFGTGALHAADTGHHRLRFMDFADGARLWTVTGSGANTRRPPGSYPAQGGAVGMRSPEGIAFAEGQRFIARAGPTRSGASRWRPTP